MEQPNSHGERSVVLSPERRAGKEGGGPRELTAMAVSAQEVSEKTARERKISPRHFRLGYLGGFGFLFGTLKVKGE